MRDCLTAFYAKSRHQIINAGGMLYQFLGDAVIALFGIPDRPGDYLRHALDCATSLSEIGDSVSNEWQRQIDRVQTASGVHIGMAIGDLQVMSLRPFSRAHMGCIGDSINMAARLMNVAGADDIVVSNMLYQRLDPACRRRSSRRARRGEERRADQGLAACTWATGAVRERFADPRFSAPCRAVRDGLIYQDWCGRFYLQPPAFVYTPRASAVGR